ncbi:MAG: hypothetical protein SWQ30_20585 [Thermodesulfobacteriota bacterium]|nr:hypothetical protein [Thermodesulfobacteriota bacterium]
MKTSRNRTAIHSRAALAALLCLCFWAACFFPVPWAAAQEETVLPESGIRYPGGFDSNTVGEVQGKVRELVVPERGPVSFKLTGERETYRVLSGPAWYWGDVSEEIADGTEVRVRGSKSLGKDGNLYMVAQEIDIVASGKSMVFRSEHGSPVWKGSRRRGAGKAGGFGSSMGRGGSAGRGGGGMRHGQH